MLAARCRVLGLSEELAGHEKAASALGRLLLAGNIAEPLCDAGERYLEIHNEAMRALKAPIGLAVSGVVGSPGDQVSDDYTAWARHAVARYETLKDALRAIGAFSVVHRVVIEDQSPADAELASLIEGLRVVAVRLNARKADKRFNNRRS